MFAADNVRVQEKGVELAEALQKNAEAKFNAGQFAAVAVIEVGAEKARRDEQLIVARNNLDFASAKLRLTINVNPDHNFLPRRVQTIDAPPVTELPLDRQKSLEQAVQQRPEIQAVALNIIQSRLIDAEGAELRSLPDYNNSIAKLKLAEGTLLQTYNVRIEGVTKEAIPWWAKF